MLLHDGSLVCLRSGSHDPERFSPDSRHGYVKRLGDTTSGTLGLIPERLGDTTSGTLGLSGTLGHTAPSPGCRVLSIADIYEMAPETSIMPALCCWLDI